ncbi:MAG: response regulator receiver modulated diguanylate cyclase/phosphodiesterase with sensor(s) [Rhodocyclaceae bacterium]|nr:response regulator receiver modulated diguanylate cyclase/phosphodiesterase with sensor(s) [Rhodocyclaceae bacterium]
MPQTTSLRALIVEDDPTDAELLLHELRRGGFDVQWQRVEEKAEYLAALDSRPDIIYSDFNLPQFDGLRALDLLIERGLDIPFIIVSGVIGEDRAVEVMRRGAWDYLLKDRLTRIGEATRQALEKRGLRQAKLRAEEEARAAGDALQAIVEAAPLAIVALDETNRIRTWNPAAEKLFGWGAGEVLCQSIGALGPPSGTSLPSLCGPEAPAPFEEVDTVCHRKDGAQIDVGLWMAPLHDQEGRISGSIRMFADISDRRRQQERIDRLMRVQTVLTEINATIVRVRDRGNLVRAACRIAVEHGGFGLAWIGLQEETPGQLVPMAAAGLAKDIRPILRPEDFSGGFTDLQLVAQALNEGATVFSNELPAEKGVGIVPKEDQGSGLGSMVALPLRVDGKVAGVFAMYAFAPGFFTDEEMHLLTEMASDVSFALDYLSKSETVSYLAYHDSLTNLPNRQLLQERVEQFIRINGQNGFAALLVFDPERFRNLNDTLGRQAGDELLRQIADRVRAELRESDTPARIGGDAFAVFLNPVQGVEEVAHLVEGKLAEALNRPFNVAGQELRVSIRIGIALFPADGGDADTLLRNAEAAQHRAREYGEKYLFYGPGMNARVSRALAMENKLRRAQEKGEFVLHYQPKISFLDGHLAGLEALLRWQDPESGLVLPARFIPLLEETGLIFDVGRWVLSRAVADRHRWRQQTGQAPRVAVNASTIQLLRKDFHAEVARVVSGNGDDASGLELEITESALMQDFEKNVNVLKKIRDMGIGIAIDDFGTGYSSLGYLSRLPVTVLKIDYSFVRDMVLRPEGMAIVSTIISLGRTFNFRVIAEGVETEEQARLLRLLRCDEGQGFLFGEAVPAEVIEQRLLLQVQAQVQAQGKH